MVTNGSTADFAVILKSMKRLLVLCVMLLLMGSAGAQKIYFIYIQSDGNRPFFVRLGDKVTSATPAGYVILPKLVDSTYQLIIGRTGNSTSESRFSVTINKGDRGFLLREADEKLSLFDLQSMTSLQPVAAATLSNEAVAKRTDPFSVLLAQAANDPSLLEVRRAVTTVQADEKKPEPTTAVSIATTDADEAQKQTDQSDTAAVSPSNDAVASTSDETGAPKNEPQKEEPAQDTVQQVIAKETLPQTETSTPDTVQQTIGKEVTTQTESIPEAKPYKLSVVTRRSESSTSEGFGLVFLDATDDAVDTIRILIPNQSFAFQKEPVKGDTDSRAFLNISSTDVAQTDTTVAAANEKPGVAEAKRKKACAEAATEKELFRLRKNMATRESEEAMIDEAKKTFKKTCFSTEQIKYLSSLFLTSGGKYQFFDAAYNYVSNQEQYSTLQTELHDAYYVNRFKALIANQ